MLVAAAVGPFSDAAVLVEAVLVLPLTPLEEATEGDLRTAVGDVTTDRVRVVDAVGEVTFLLGGTAELEVVDVRLEGTVVFLVTLGVVEVVEVTEVRLVTPGVAVARVVPGVARVVVVAAGVVPVLVTPGVLEARIELVAVGLVAVEVRDVTGGLEVVDFVMGVLEAAAEGVRFTVEGDADVPARPAAAKDDIRLFTVGAESDIVIK